MNEKEIKQLENIKTSREAKSESKEFHANRILELQDYISKPKGLIRKKCPECDNILTSTYICTNPFRYIILYGCKCGYEYAVARTTRMP